MVVGMDGGELSSNESSQVIVDFALTQGSEGRPPVGVERLWAVPLSSDVVRIDSVPWSVRNLVLGDLLLVSKGVEQGFSDFRAIERVKWSGNCTIRLIPALGDSAEVTLQTIIDKFLGLGIDGEALVQYGMIALNVPPGPSLTHVEELVVQGSRKGWWEYEEGCVSSAWKEAY